MILSIGKWRRATLSNNSYVADVVRRAASPVVVYGQTFRRVYVYPTPIPAIFLVRSEQVPVDPYTASSCNDDAWRTRPTYDELRERLAESEEALATLRGSEAKYRILFDSITEGFVIVETVRNKEGGVVDVIYRELNKAAARLTRFDPAPGRRAREVTPDPDESRYEHSRRWAAVLFAIGLTTFENLRPRC